MESNWTQVYADFPNPLDTQQQREMTGQHGQISTPRRIQKQLACVSCRRKKVKCQPSEQSNTGCTLCMKLGTTCIVPDFDERKQSNSRKLIRELYARISTLEAELENHRTYCLSQANTNECSDISDQPEVFSPLSTHSESSNSTASDNMIVRLCGGQRQLNSDGVGRLRFFGPTSSLHLTESVTSSVLIQESNGKRMKFQWQDDFSLETQNYLLDIFWTYQHHVVNKEAFLRDMANGDTKYCSKLLLYCLLTRAAAISDQPALRALALADDSDDDPPFLIKKCVHLLDTELNNPTITTCQSLQFLSEAHAAISNDTKGWMYAGGACRLAFELGLHSDSAGMNSNLSEVDLDIRQLVFWGCFNLDRQWGLYLGRPQCIKLDDVSVSRPNGRTQKSSFEMSLCGTWTNLLEIVGQICDILNGVKTIRQHVVSLDSKLREWYSGLDPSFCYHSKQSPAIFLLHMQYAAALILLHRPLAYFGNDSMQTPEAESSRSICVENACSIAQYLQEYFEQHGSVMTLSWISLHMIATASTTLVANIAERSGNVDMKRQLVCLQKCMRSLNELEKSHVVTRRVRKVIQHAIRLLNLDATVGSASSLYEASGSQLAGLQGNLPLLSPTQELNMSPGTLENTGQPFAYTEILPAWSQSQFHMLNSFESYFS